MKIKYFLVLFTLLILINSAFALRYNFYLDNGTWNQYTAGLSSSYYAPDLFESINNRGFENSFTLLDGNCFDSWCRSGGLISSGTQSDYFYEGSSSLKINFTYGTHGGIIFASDEIVSDSLISFYHKSLNYVGDFYGSFRYGYVNKSGDFISVGTTSFGVFDWTKVEYYIPKGDFKVAFQPLRSAGGTLAGSYDWFIDTISVKRNNSGTFRAGSVPNSCSNLESCSNLSYNLPSNELDNLYWVVDYVPAATCQYFVNGVSKGVMTEGLNGLYYVLVNEEVGSRFYLDLNLSASCSKIPFISKTFFVSPRLYRYGNINNGNMETPFLITTAENTCSDYWCMLSSGGGLVHLKTSDDKIDEGQYSLELKTTGWMAQQIFYNQYIASDEIVSFKFVDLVVEPIAASYNFQYGYLDPSNNFTIVGSITSPPNSDINYYIPNGNYRIAFKFTNGNNSVSTHILNIDNIISTKVKPESFLNASNSLTDNVGVVGSIVTFYSEYLNKYDLPITDAECKINILGDDINMIYNSGTGKYSANYGFVTTGFYDIEHICSSDYFSTANDDYIINIGVPVSNLLTITPIKNISSFEYSVLSVLLNLSSNNEDVIFKVETSDAFSGSFVWNNSFRKNNYLIYTSDNGSDWVFNDSLTFGSTIYNGLQKKYLGSSYQWSMNDVLLKNQVKYYKFEVQEPALNWATIKESSDWIKVSPSSIYIDADGINWDTFNNSSVSPLNFYTYKKFPELFSDDLSKSFILKFNAYLIGTDEEQDIKFGAKGGSLSTATIGLEEQSYYLNIFGAESNLLITSDETDSFQLVISDFAIIPRAYFIDSISVFNRYGGSLPAMVVNGTSEIYIQETLPFLMKTRAYNTSGLIHSIKTDVILLDDNSVIRTYFWDVSNTPKNAPISISKLLDGVIYYSKSDQEDYIFMPLEKIYIKNTLIDSNGRSVAEQSTGIGVVQYPYFANDISVRMNNLSAKVGKNPKFNLSLSTNSPQSILGIEFSIHADLTPIESNPPIYTKFIPVEELGCLNLAYCSKDITFEDFVYEYAWNYSILANVIVTTQSPDAIWKGDDYLNQNLRVAYVLPVVPSLTQFDTARVLQVFERTNHNYSMNPFVESVPLVFQARNDDCSNMKNDYLVEMTSIESEVFSKVSYQPQKFIFDAATCYNYWFFNVIFTRADGLPPDPDMNLYPLARVTSLKQETENAISYYALTDKCIDYPLDMNNFNLGTFIMSWFGLDPQYKCITDAPLVKAVPDDDPLSYIDTSLTFVFDYTPESNQSQSLYCYNADKNKSVDLDFGNEIICMVVYRKSEEQIDKFRVIIGNEFSDYSKTGIDKQYLTFEIPQEQIMFNDAQMMKAALDKSYTTDRIDTLGEFLFAGFNTIVPYFNGTIEDFLNGLWFAGINEGVDLNLSESFNPNYVSGIFFYKITGLQVTNINDYLADYPDLVLIDPSDFRTFALNNNISLGKKEALVQIYSNDFKTFSSFKTDSPFVIFEKPSVQRGDDINSPVIPTKLNFTFINDMVSAGFTKIARAYIPLTFTYKVPAAPLSWGNLAAAVDDFISNPIDSTSKALLGNWFLIAIMVAGLLVGSVVYLNYKVARRE